MVTPPQPLWRTLIHSRHLSLHTREVEKERETEVLLGRLASLFSSALNVTATWSGNVPLRLPLLQAEATHLASSCLEANRILSPQQGPTELVCPRRGRMEEVPHSAQAQQCVISYCQELASFLNFPEAWMGERSSVFILRSLAYQEMCGYKRYSGPLRL